MDGIIRSHIQGATAFINDHSALWAWKMDDILLIVCSKSPAMEPIYKYVPNCLMNFRNKRATSINFEGRF